MKMSFDVYDMLGFEIKEDDYVVGSFSSGSSAVTRIGRVVERKTVQPKNYGIVNQAPNHYLKIKWIHGFNLPKNASLIFVTPGNKCQLLKVALDGIN